MFNWIIENWYFILIFLIMVGLICWIAYKNKTDWQTLRGVEQSITAKGIDMNYAKLRGSGFWGFFTKGFQQTPWGVEIIATVVIPDDVMLNIDAAYKESIRRIGPIFPTWKEGMTPERNRIVFVDPMAETEQGNPSLITAGIETAGSVLKSNNSMGYPCVIVPHQEKIAWSAVDYLYNSIYNEREHELPRRNDLRVFDEGIVSGHIHPRWPDDRSPVVSLARHTEPEPFACGMMADEND